MKAPWQEGLPDDAFLLVALSGGADSVYTLHLLRTEYPQYRIEAAHLDHRLRGDESDGDRLFVEELCARWDVPLHCQRIDTALLMGRRPPDEDQLRQARLGFLRSLAMALGADAIATGHHQNDVAETFLLMALRGSGPAGPGGLLPSRAIPGTPLRLVRPLLELSRDAIRARLTDAGITWREDSSNASPEHRRNRIRHEIMPRLEAIEPATVRMLATTAAYCGDLAALADRLAQRHLDDRELVLAIASDDERAAVLLRSDALRERVEPQLLPHLLKKLLGLLAERTGNEAPLPNRDVLTRVSARLSTPSGDESLFHVKQFNLRIGNRYALAWTGHEELDAWLSCADGFPFPIIHPSGPSGNLTIDAATEPGPFCAYIPEAEVVGTPRLLPLMPDDDLSLTGGGRKSISETLREAGVPPLLRPHVAGVRDDNRLLWIPGIRGLASLESQPAPGLIALSWRQKISP